MTFAELFESLPNGLYDADLRGLAMDYARGELVLDVDVGIGRMTGARQEIYRPARVTLGDVAFLTIDPPASGADLDAHTGIRIDAGPGAAKGAKLPEVPEGTAMAWVFLADLNRLLHFAARSASLAGAGPPQDRDQSPGRC